MPPPSNVLASAPRAQLRHAAAVLNERAAAGFVRRCHGDLHLNNIVLWRGRPVLFDAIEFDEDLATIDTLYDLAFLLMDLDKRGQRQRRQHRAQSLSLALRTRELDLRGLAGPAAVSGAQGRHPRHGDGGARRAGEAPMPSVRDRQQGCETTCRRPSPILPRAERA